jgi:bifunctional non-homologous end joining protein LigD
VPLAPYSPMLASTGALPAGAGWAYELKWDGVRAIAVITAGVARFWARSGAEITAAYPELAGLADELAAKGVADAVLDGEVVLMDQAGRPSFEALAERMHVRAPARAARLAATIPVTYMIFDLLRVGDQDRTHLPYTDRRSALDALALEGPRWMAPPVFDDGAATYAASRENGLEGVVAKRMTSTYRQGVRSPDWIKVKADDTADFVVGGWRPGVRKIGGLLVGVPVGEGVMAFRGRVGGGISAAAQERLLTLLTPLITDRSPFGDSVPREDARGAIWVRPEVVVEVKFGNRTRDGRLRFPRYLRLRPDLTPEQVTDGGV